MFSMDRVSRTHPKGPHREIMDSNFHSQHRWGIGTSSCLQPACWFWLPSGIIAAYEFRYSDRVYRGVSCGGHRFRGVDLDEATEVGARWPYTLPGATITLRYGRRTWSLSSVDFGVAVDAPATAAAAFEIGRQGLTASFAGPIASLWRGLRTDLGRQWAALRQGDGGDAQREVR